MYVEREREGRGGGEEKRRKSVSKNGARAYT